MEAEQFLTMTGDKHFFDLKKMQYKYSPSAVQEMLEILDRTSAAILPIRDFHGRELIFREDKAKIPPQSEKLLLAAPASDRFGMQAMEEEIHSSLAIENIRSERESIRKILRGYAPQNAAEEKILGMKRGLDLIAERSFEISEENLFRLYRTAVGSSLAEEDQLLPGRWYRHDKVYVVGMQVEHEGLPSAQLPEYMKRFVEFINTPDGLNELAKAALIHFYFAYLHPYFDGNGRTARLLQIWYLIQRGYPAALFVSFSEHINRSRPAYYRAYRQIEENERISGRIDATPFVAYFSGHVYRELLRARPEDGLMQRYQAALAAGEITPKEKLLWEFVLSFYGSSAFSTKQLEKDHGDAAYATIRSFVLKFSELGLLQKETYGSRNRYRAVGFPPLREEKGGPYGAD